jgi:CheY-like chemotaxis protein
LLVDDEPLVRMSAAEMLSELGYRVVEAGSAENALQRVREGLRPNLLITDHLMPGMSGTDLGIALRDQYPELQILVVSGYANNEGITPDLSRLTKPFRSDELTANSAKAVGSVVQRRATASAPATSGTIAGQSAWFCTAGCD